MKSDENLRSIPRRLSQYSAMGLAALASRNMHADIVRGSLPDFTDPVLAFRDELGQALFAFVRHRSSGTRHFSEHYGTWCWPSPTSCTSKCKNWRRSTTYFYQESWALSGVRIRQLDVGELVTSASQGRLDLGTCESRFWSYARSCPTFPQDGATYGCGWGDWYSNNHWGLEIELQNGERRFGWMRTWKWLSPRDGLYIEDWAFEDSGKPILVGDTGMVPSSLFPTIQSAIDALEENAVVRIAPGTYTEAIDFRGKAITIEGNIADPTAVVFDGTSLMGTSVARMITGEGPDTVLRGVTIRHGTSGTPWPSDPINGPLVGGAIFTDHASPTIECCIFESNEADFGGAIYSRGGSPTVRRCTFRDNRALEDGGALQNGWVTNGLVEDCVFDSNTATIRGGAIHLPGGNNTVRGCTIINNTVDPAGEGGGGISWYAQTNGTLAIESCEITNNTAPLGGGLWVIQDGTAPNVSGSRICDNDPDQIFGSWSDAGDNDLCECSGDLSGNGVVDGTDLGIWLAYAGKSCHPGPDCPGDLDGNGEVSGGDLGILLSMWGSCE